MKGQSLLLILLGPLTVLAVHGSVARSLTCPQPEGPRPVTSPRDRHHCTHRSLNSEAGDTKGGGWRATRPGRSVRPAQCQVQSGHVINTKN